VDPRQQLEIGQPQFLIRLHRLARRADANRIARVTAMRFMTRLQRTGEIEDLDLRQEEKNHLFDVVPASASSFTMSLTHAMRAKRLRSTNSVRRKISAVVNSSPFSEFTIGNVCVASVMKSASYPR